MFEKKKCPNCGEKLKEEWNFCPFCGEELGERALIPSGEDIFEDIEKEFEKMDKMFGLSPFKISGFKSKPFVKGGGISITIRSGAGEPKIEIKTSGEYKKLEPELKKKFGVKPAIEEVEEEKKERRIAKVTEEPETEVKTMGNKQIISIKLPDVKSEEDIEMKRLEQSLEIKAFAGDKAYFTLIPLASSASVVKKEFKGGILKIEVER